MPREVVFLLSILFHLILSFFLSLAINKILILLQNKKHYYQPIRDELNELHKNKKNTPTLGGIGIYLGSILTMLLLNFKAFSDYEFLLIFITVTAFFLIGLIDDLMKIIKKDFHGQKGIIRLVFEFLTTFILLRGLGFSFSDFQFINLFTIHLFIGGLSVFVLSLIVVGCANAMNLTDGLDGLAATLFIIMILPFCIYAFKNNYYEIGYFMISVFGASLGFIRYNIHPSKIFMGDNGSLFLGGFLGSISILFHLEYILMISGFVLIVETLSVILQVVYFKITHKRIFLMSPLHHHFELLGISEDKIVLIFIIVGYVCSFVSLLIIV